MDEMKSHGLQLQRLTYNSLILACVRGGDMARAFELLTAMKVLDTSLFVNCLEQNTHLTLSQPCPKITRIWNGGQDLSKLICWADA